MIKDIKGYEGLYQISSDGKVYSKDRYVKGRYSKRLIKGKALKTYLDKSGYERVDLYKNNHVSKCKVHRLVLITFDKERKDLDVNHIDGNKLNNSIDNLEWCTRKENIHHAVINGLNKQSQRICAIKGEEKYTSSSIYGMYDVLKDMINIECTRHTFGTNVLRAINTDGIYYGFKFRRVVV